MSTVLVVDDSAVDRHLAGRLLEKQTGLTDCENPTGLTPAYAANGKDALDLIGREAPGVVVTDLLMPEMNGLELVEEIRTRHPALPVILMTAHGSEEIAVRALQNGAAGYVPKKKLHRDLLETVRSVLEVATAKHARRQILASIGQAEFHFDLANDETLIAPLIGHLEESLIGMGLCDENGLIRIGVALREAVLNAMHHGNLEVGSELYEEDERAYSALVEERLRQSPYRQRRVRVQSRITRGEARFTVRDEGPGFDPSRAPEPTDPANLTKARGRGLCLIRVFMDEVSHNDRGNEIVMIKQCCTDRSRRAPAQG